MNRITKKFAELKQTERKALISYITAGDPSIEMTLAIMQQLVKNGVDILELGMAFSDPVADGVVIQAAHQRALKAGITLNKLFDLVIAFRKMDSITPIVLMGYINPIENMGYARFINKLVEAGIDGVLVVDLPVEESYAFVSDLNNHSISPIFLISPTTSLERAKNIATVGSGFLYLVSLKGVTGANKLDIPTVASQINQIKNYTDLPIAVGFGIRDGKSAANVAKCADAVVVGSGFVALIEGNLHNKDLMLDQIARFTLELRSGIDN